MVNSTFISYCCMHFEFGKKLVDFTLAFVHAKSEPGYFIEVPKVFVMEGYVLKIRINIYVS